MPFASTFVQDGRTIDYTPGSAVAAGDVILLQKMLGVAAIDIAANTLGALMVHGVHSIAKVTGETWTTGQILYWDNSVKKLTTTVGSNVACAKAWADQLSGDTSGLAKINV